MSAHPFRYPYIGLGLLDEASIERDADGSVARYLHEGDPYLRLRVQPDRATIEEFEADGTPVATTSASALQRAILLHGQNALRGEPSRFWERATRRTPHVYAERSLEQDFVMACCPAIGIGILRVPVPLDSDWVEPTPGPVSRRAGVAADRDPFGPRLARLHRWVDDAPASRPETVRLKEYGIPGIVLGEFANALVEANRTYRSIEWRPILSPDVRPNVGHAFSAIARYGVTYDGGLLTGYAVIPEPVAVRA